MTTREGDFGTVVPGQNPPENATVAIDASALGTLHFEAPEIGLTTQPSRWFALACAASALFHGAMVFGLSLQTSSSSLGGSDQPLEAISVEIVNLAAPASAPITASVQSAAQPAAPASPPEVTAPAKRALVVALEQPDRVPDEEALTEIIPPETPPRPIEIAPPAATPDSAPDQPPQREPSAEKSVAGPPERAEANAAATIPTTANPVKVTASQGAVRVYNRRVAQALARSPPKRVSRNGRVEISFRIGIDGALEWISVSASSGNTAIDGAALTAVRRTRFPSPPQGATTKQRSFVIPYRFRQR